MEIMPGNVADGNVLDDDRSTVILSRSSEPCASDFPYVPTRIEVELDQWVHRRLSRTPELRLPVPKKPKQLLRYIPETQELGLIQSGGFVASYEPIAFTGETVTLQIGTQDVVVKHKITGGAIPNHGGGGKRGKITRLSKGSIKRMKLAARNVPDGSFEAFLTLTYPDAFPTDGLKVKRDLSVFRKWCKRRGIGAFWFLEFQERGAPHFHLFLSNYPLGGVEAVSTAWARIVGSGDPKHLAWHRGELSGRPCLEYMRKPHAASFYATKYASKQEQKDVPADYANVGRFWGMFGNMRPVWRFVVGYGSHCGKVTKDMVNNFRCGFDDRAMQKHWVNKLFVLTVMWGVVAELDALMAFVKWTPF